MNPGCFDGGTIDYSDYAYVINNPWGQWKQDAKKAHFEGGGYSAKYDFDPNGNRVFVDEMPGKVVK